MRQGLIVASWFGGSNRCQFQLEPGWPAIAERNQNVNLTIGGREYNERTDGSFLYPVKIYKLPAKASYAMMMRAGTGGVCG